MMRKTLLPLLALILVLTAALMPGAVQAQETVTLASMSIRAWPEFDDPSVLLIIEGQAVTFGPVELTIPLPPGARINAAAYPDPATGNLLTAEYTQTDNAIVLQSPEGAFWIEVYDPGLAFDGDDRTYTLDWIAPFDIALLNLEVQTPFGARSMEIVPEPETTGTDQFNLPVAASVMPEVKAGDAVTVTFSYTKTDPTLSAEWLNQTLPSETAPTAPEPLVASGGGPSTLVIVLLTLGGLALVGGGVWYVVQASRKPVARSARRVPSARDQGQRFCTQCGKPIEPGDKFCRHCGAKA